ncbi:MAG: M23 family metallopeptidase [Parcubacteria group bacterium]
MHPRSLIIFFFTLVIGLFLSGCTSQTVNANLPANSNTAAVTNTAPQVKEFVPPLDRPAERITKKPFGVYITPETSPIQPEKFTGYHTGADFEILPGEENSDMKVTAACTGVVRVKQTVSGYGGVLIQDCTLGGEAVTVLYGHLNKDSITIKVGETLTQGDFIGNLGKGYSTQTDGERKHLHLSIHKGMGINYKGYVSAQSQLDEWLGSQQYL